MAGFRRGSAAPPKDPAAVALTLGAEACFTARLAIGVGGGGGAGGGGGGGGGLGVFGFEPII